MLLRWIARGKIMQLTELIALGRFNYWICTRGTRFCQFLSWHHLLFWIRFYCCVLFITYWFLESRFRLSDTFVYRGISCTIHHLHTSLPVFSLICMAYFGSCQWILIEGGVNMRENKRMLHTSTGLIYPGWCDFWRIGLFCSETLSSSGFDSITTPYWDNAICDVTTNAPLV